MEAHGLNPKAVAAMKADGIDITSQTSKLIDLSLASRADYLVTLCGDAKDRCPTVFNPKAHLHWDIEDPAKFIGSEEEITKHFRKARNAIKNQVLELKNYWKAHALNYTCQGGITSP